MKIHKFRLFLQKNIFQKYFQIPCRKYTVLYEQNLFGHRGVVSFRELIDWYALADYTWIGLITANNDNLGTICVFLPLMLSGKSYSKQWSRLITNRLYGIVISFLIIKQISNSYCRLSLGLISFALLAFYCFVLDSVFQLMIPILC